MIVQLCAGLPTPVSGKDQERPDVLIVMSGAVVGVVTVGLFAARGANVALIGAADGVQTIQYT